MLDDETPNDTHDANDTYGADDPADDADDATPAVPGDSALAAWERATFTHLRADRRGIAAYVTLTRPEVHNAFNEQLIADLRSVFELLDADESLRAVVLVGEGRSFCAGADLHWMRSNLERTHDENVADALRMADLFRTIDRCRHPVIARIQGAALGGGCGLAAVADIVIAAEDARFGFTEARLGIAPAVISPFAIRKIGQSHARALFITGARFDADHALAIGLAHRVVPASELDAAVADALTAIAQCGPEAVRASKRIAQIVPTLPDAEARLLTANTIADLRVSPQGQEGIRAFLEKRRAAWIPQDPQEGADA
ncbi:MAG TPA: enoyl-CoA hydratase-related protein [Ktedonobacterales bacterium]|nr:enoyl-CoA hydratase-related protein [Ktedonobacterales bacterium]